MVKLLFSVCLLLIFALPTNAQTTTNRNTVPAQQRILEATQLADQSNTGVNSFRERVGQIVDQAKRSIVENIISRISGANTRLTTTMVSALDKLQVILERLKAQAENFAAGGENIVVFLSTIENAQNAIDEAREVVDAQAEKEYSATITDDLTLRTAIGAMVAEFRNDIEMAFGAVSSAKDAVQNAIDEAKTLSNNSTPASNSATINIE